VTGTTQRTRSRLARLLTVLIQVAFLAAVAIAIRDLGTGSTSATTLPQLVGRDRQVAGAVLETQHLHAVWKVAGRGPAGKVVSQVPPAGAKVSRGNTVVLTVARSRRRSVLPDVTRLRAARAQTTLRRSGFRVTRRNDPSAAGDAGKVAWTSPAPFSLVAPRARVVLIVSTGASRPTVPQVTVPHALGALLPVAERRLLRARMKVVVTERQSTRKAGTVLGQTPRPGARVRRGAVVRLVVAAAIPRVGIPLVVGQRERGAATAISSLGLTVAFADRPVRRASQLGVVLAQTPRAGRKVERGSTVTLTVGRPRAHH
jgi:beta-lactam-binding protein with PASTA domain